MLNWFFSDNKYLLEQLLFWNTVTALFWCYLYFVSFCDNRFDILILVLIVFKSRINSDDDKLNKNMKQIKKQPFV